MLFPNQQGHQKQDFLEVKHWGYLDAACRWVKMPEWRPNLDKAMLNLGPWANPSAFAYMQGVLGEESVILHVWLRMAPPAVASPRLCMQRWPVVPNCNKTGVARGFALLQSVRKSIPYYNRAGIQLLQAASLLKFSQKLYLRCADT